MACARIVHVASAFAAMRTFAFTARLAMNAETLMLNSATSLTTTLQSARIQLQGAAICYTPHYERNREEYSQSHKEHTKFGQRDE
jgi:hypothetical protein